MTVLNDLDTLLNTRGKDYRCDITFTCAVPFWRKRAVTSYINNVTILFVKHIDSMQMSYTKHGQSYSFNFSGPVCMVKPLVENMCADLNLKQVLGGK